MKAKARDWIIGVGLFCVPIALIGFGVLVGRYSIIRSFDSKIEGVSTVFTLGSLLTDEEKRGVSRAYHEPDSVLLRFDEIPVSVPNSLTPFVGSAPTPGVHVGSQINSMQFRSAREIEIPKPRNSFRIFITGGSTAFGTGSPSQDRTIAGYLSVILAREMSPLTNLTYDVITAANPAWASTHERIFIENRLSELEPDLVISISGNNDVHWGKRGRNILWFRTYADQFFFSLVKTAYRYSGQKDIPKITQKKSSEIAPDVVAGRLLKNVDLITHVLSDKKVMYVFVLQPTLALTNKRLTSRERKTLKDQDYFQKSYSLIDSTLVRFSAENFNYFNLVNIFDDLDDQNDVFIDSYHFGDKGNEIIAENIFMRIRDLVVR